MSKIKILLVEHDKSEAKELQSTLEHLGYDVPYIVSTGEEAVKQVLNNSPDLILMNILSNGDMDCIEAASHIKKFNIPIIYLTIPSENCMIEQTKITEPYGYIIKPYDTNQLRYTIELALYKNMMKNKLKESEKRYSELVNNSMVGIYKADMQGDITFANNAMVKIFNFENVQDLKRKKLFKLYKNQNDWDKSIKKLQNDGSFSDMEVEMVSNDNEPVTVLLSCYMENNSISGMMMDISGRKKIEEELKEREEKYRKVFNNANDMISLNLMKENGLPGKFIDINKVGIERLGYTRDEFLNMTPSNIVDQNRRHEMSITAQKLKKNGAVEFEIIHNTKNGKKIPVEVNNHIFELNGQKVALAISRDISERKRTEHALQDSEERFRMLFERSNAVMTLIDPDSGNIIDANPSATHFYGYSSDELQNMNIDQINDIPSEKFYKATDITLKEGSNFIIPQKLANGEIRTVEVFNSPIEFNGKTIIFSITNDITQRKEMEDALRKSEEKYRMLFEEDPYFNMILGKDGTILDVNNTITHIMGLAKEDIIGKNFSQIETIPKDDLEEYYSKIKSLLNGQYVEPFESHFRDIDGNISYVLIHLKAIMDNGNISYILAIGGDITQRKIAENEIKTSLAEKNTLLQEIHHRVKNNMQIISSLLNLQIKYVDDGKAVDVLKESQNRVKSMAMIHDKLYMSEDLTRINFVNYIKSLVTNLFYSYNVEDTIKQKLEIDPISLNMETAVPCGLIISELVSNSLKYAFPDGMIGEIFVSLRSKEDNFELIISDNGIGLPKEFDINNTKTLGLMLVSSLTEQIDGKIIINRENGTRFTIIFKESIYKERI
ncbi:MAG: PAS domain S-box protein [Methanobacterium sp.]|uniref:PAS domain S-box protein n=1 Tax=Methanobacterium sp. TaxID=2164 RepID=UPI003C710D92